MRFSQLKKYLDLDQKGSIIAEYVWIDSVGGVRSKCKVRCWRMTSSDRLPAVVMTSCLRFFFVLFAFFYPIPDHYSRRGEIIHQGRKKKKTATDAHRHRISTIDRSPLAACRLALPLHPSKSWMCVGGNRRWLCRGLRTAVQLTPDAQGRSHRRPFLGRANGTSRRATISRRPGLRRGFRPIRDARVTPVTLDPVDRCYSSSRPRLPNPKRTDTAT